MTCGNFIGEVSYFLLLFLLSLMRLPIQIEAILYKRIQGKIQYLILKTIPRRGGFWQPITGGLEKGETKLEALKREVREETGIENIVKIVKDVHYFEFQDHSFLQTFQSSPKHLKEYAFGVEVSSEEEVVLDGKEHSEYRWCGYEEALRLLKWKENREALGKLNNILRRQN